MNNNNNNNKECNEMKEKIIFTLKKIQNGGIHDHIGGGFHRYSVDKYWHIPHYEKMIYDQAQLIQCFVEAYQISNKENPDFLETTKQILNYIHENLTHKEGGIFSAEDADSLNENENKMSEGAYYIWKYDEIEKILGKTKDFEIFCDFYGILKDGNTKIESDPHGELLGTNTLFINNNIDKLSIKYEISIENVKEILFSQKIKLKNFRINNRKKPSLDDKIITSWNGLMLSAFCKSYQVIKDPNLLQKAENLAMFVRKYLFKDNNLLLRSFKDGPSDIFGFTSDYALFIRGLIDLYESSGNEFYLSWAFDLQKQQDTLFWDETSGAYWNTTESNQILIRSKEIYDGAEPSENSISFYNLLRLAKYFDDSYLFEQAERLLAVFHMYLNKAPHISPELVSNITSIYSGKQIVIVGDLNSTLVKSFMDEVHFHFDPFKVLIFYNQNSEKLFKSKLSFLQQIPLDKPAVYICENQTCSLPIYTRDDLKQALSKK